MSNVYIFFTKNCTTLPLLNLYFGERGTCKNLNITFVVVIGKYYKITVKFALVRPVQ